MGKLRVRGLAGLHGEVLELGFGSGGNVGHYPDEVSRVLAVEPSQRARQLAAKRLAGSTVPIEFVGLDGQSVPLPDHAADNALATWTLCTIPDVSAALDEVRRILRPGGQLWFLEHGRSTDPKVERRQHRFEPLQRRCAGGCHLTRRPDEALTAAGYDLVEFYEFDVAGPRFLTHMFAGRAVPT
jgi:SAM-dependent methyltransferase